MSDNHKLDKGNKQFDLSKKKRSFDLTKDEVNAPKANKPENKNANAKKKLIAISTVVAACLLAYLLIDDSVENKKDNGNNAVVASEDNGRNTVVTPKGNGGIIEQPSHDSNVAVIEQSIPNGNDVVIEQPVHVDVERGEVKLVSSKKEVEPVDNSNDETAGSQVLTPEKVEQKALEVIRGDFGNNPERRRKLGSDYEVIQKKVNEMYRKGLVY